MEDSPLRLLVLGIERVSERPAGLGRYAESLVGALVEEGAQADSVWVPRDAAGLARFWRYHRLVSQKAISADLLDAHFALFALLPSLVGPGSRLPLVVHFQGPWADESRAAGERSALRLTAKRLVERAVYRRAREIVTLSGAFKRVLVERYSVSPWDIHVVPPGVDLDRFMPAPDRASVRGRHGLAPDAWVALAVRRLVPRTGVDVLLDAWAALDHSAVLLIAGEGPERTRLEERAAALGLGERVRFLGRVPEDELVAWYQAADACVVPSLDLEGFGLVVLEALACGTPVVATEVGGLPEALRALGQDLLVPPSDPGRLGERLERARTGEVPLPSRKRCREYAEGFGWPQVARTHLELYARAVTRPPRTRLRVVYVDHCARLSGAEIALLRLLPTLRGVVDAHVILGEDGPLVPRLVQAGISVEVLSMSAAARELPRDRVSSRRIPAAGIVGTGTYSLRLARRLRRLRPDLVHTNSLKAALYGGAAARLVRVPVVWHARDRIAGDYLPAEAVRLVRALRQLLPAGVIAVSEAALQTFDRSRPAEKGVSSVIHDPVIPPGRIEPRRGGVFCAGMVGRLAPWKGQHVFVEAFARAFPDGPERAVIVGAPLFGEADYERSLRELGSRLGLDGRLEFAGFREDVWSELARFDVLVHASVLPEPGGQVVLEGMAAGLPVVAASAGGPAEVVDDGVNGLLCPPGDVGALAAALEQLARDAALRRRLGEAARDASRQFAPEIVAEQVLDLYARVLQGRPRR